MSLRPIQPQLPFGRCLWWLLPSDHVWNHVAKQQLGAHAWAQHPFHVTIRTNVDEATRCPGLMGGPTVMKLLGSVRLTCMEFGQNQRFYAIEAPLQIGASTDPHISLGYRLNSTFQPHEIQAATTAVAAMRNEAPEWIADASAVVLIDCSRPVSSWMEQVLNLQHAFT